MADILVVDDEESIAAAFRRFLEDEGHDFRIASSAEEGLSLISARPPNIVFMDVRMPGGDGVEALQAIRAKFPQVYVVMMTAYGSSRTSIETIRAGAFDYLTKPLDLDNLRSVIAKALAAQWVRDSSGDAPAEDAAMARVRLIGEAPAIQEVYKMIGRLATNDVPALILGERGTGKQLVARTIHESSGRSTRPFVALDCESMPESVVESSLFDREGGSVYISAIERMPALLQSRLTRALTSDRTDESAAHPRVFAASEADLAEGLRSGSLRRELHDVLSVITLRLPPLRERPSDIPLLVRHFIQRLNDELSRTIRGMDDQVLRRLQEHPWPGNVGELERVVKRACIIARGDVITIDEIADSLTDSRFDREDVETALSQATRTALHERLVDRSPLRSSTPYHDIIDLVESTLVREALTITNGNQVKAADILGVNRATLRKKMVE
ncbi:MAG: sigma-54 dependent transcriptional regulator [Vicinamibacterales bacterium]